MRRPAFRDLLVLSALLLSFQIFLPTVASAENRVALVIGQSAYRAVPALPNAANDGRHMADLLGSAGFDVTAAPDLAQNDMRQAIGDFAAKVAAKGPDTVALVFYAGHGLQIDGENYLVPVDVDPKREADIPLQAVRLNDLMNTLGALPARMRIFMLDACRNNPFPALSQTAGHGLAIVNTKAGAPGSFISFSTSPGAEAEDGSGEDSPYTTAVLSVAKEPNLTIEEAFKRVRVSVNQATDGRQVPWESSSLTSDFMFFAGKGSGQTGSDQPGSGQVGSGQGAALKAPTVTRTAEDWRRDLGGKDPKLAYELVIADDSVAAYEAFGALFGQSTYAPRVRSLLERRKEMLAWEVAVATNTAASYETFLSMYAGGDLAATARKMQVRVINRTLPAPVNVAMGPTCPCPTAPVQPLLKKVEPAPQPPTKRADKRKRSRGDDEPVVVESAPSGPPPGAIIEGVGIGIGLGLGGMRGGMGGGGMGGGMRGGMPPNRMYDR
jgi:Caspase domain